MNKNGRPNGYTSNIVVIKLKKRVDELVVERDRLKKSVNFINKLNLKNKIESNTEVNSLLNNAMIYLRVVENNINSKGKCICRLRQQISDNYKD